MIERETVDKVIEASQNQIIDIISDFVNLRKRGVNYLGCCPFHNEKTPSFTVSPTKGIYKCFGCGKAGNAVGFVMEHESLTFPEAIKMLGRRFNIEVVDKEATPEEQIKNNERESLMIVTEFAAQFFSQSLHETDEGKSVALSYFRLRQLQDNTIHQFGLGYSPEKFDALTQAAVNKGYKTEYLVKAGLSIENENRVFDRFHGRVIFPIHNLSGKVIAFGGRVMRSDVKTAKYVNSPESDIYHKSSVLYGIFQARQEISKRDKVYLVEGYLDVISFHQSGITNCVASSGTALTVDQIKLMARFTQNITVIYDGDSAGIKASLRGIDMLLQENMNVRALLLPDGDDPDSFSHKHSSDELVDYLAKNEIDFIKFKTSLLLEETKNDPIKKAQLIQEIVRTISLIPNRITQSVFMKECSTMMQVDEPVLYSELNKITGRQIEKENYKIYEAKQKAQSEQIADNERELPKITVVNPTDKEELELLEILFANHSAEIDVVNEDDELTTMRVDQYIINELERDGIVSANPLYRKVIDSYRENMKNDDFSIEKYFVNSLDVEISHFICGLISPKYEESKIHKKRETTTVSTSESSQRVVIGLKWKIIKTRIEETLNQIKTAQTNSDENEIIELTKRLMNLQQIHKKLSIHNGERAVWN